MSPGTRLAAAIAQFVLVTGGVAALLVFAARSDVISLGSGATLWLLAAVALNTLALTLMGWRLSYLGTRWRLVPPGTSLVGLNYRSLFYLFVLPLGIGMETARYVGLRHLAADATRADTAAAVLTDRAAGLVAACIAAALGWWLLGGHVAWLLCALLAAATAMVVGRRWSPLSVSELGVTLLLAIAFHASTYAALYCACIALSVDVGLWAMVFAVAAGVVGAVVPVALFGLQAGDLATAGVLGLLGVPALTASLVAALAYASRLQGALIGATLELQRAGTDLGDLLRKGEPDG